VKRRRVGPIAERKLDQLGIAGAQWYAALDDLVDELAAAWTITVGAELAGGTHAYVAEAVTAGGVPAVLKVALPELDNPGKHFEVPVMLAGQGRGYAKVFAHDEGRRALLLERLGPSLGDSGATVDEQLQIICGTLSPWAPAPPGLDVPTGAGKAAWLREFVEAQWTELGRPCSESAIRQMQAFANITLTVIHFPDHVLRHVTLLTPLQLDILNLLGLPPDIYRSVARNSP
jgi:streptomycin 6-kinase